MAKFEPTQHDYLALVSEWQGSGGAVGNAYPLYCLTAQTVVTDPVETFPNSGAIFLMSRAGLRTWDFVVMRPAQNVKYSDPNKKFECYYIPSHRPNVLTQPMQLESIATILDHPSFDVGGSRQIVSPKCNVTPLFFVRKQQLYYGPLIRETTHLSPNDDLLRIDWRPAREDSVVFEFTRDELEKEGVKIVAYQHPDQLNRVVMAPIELAVGKLRLAKSTRSRDGLAEESLIEWYLQRCSENPVSRETLKSMQSSFKGRVGEDERIQDARLKRVERLIATHSGFQDERERFAKQYLDSPAGEKRVQDALEQSVAQRAAQIQTVVDDREKDLAHRRDDLARQLTHAEGEHQKQLADLKVARDTKQTELEKLDLSLAQLRENITDKIELISAEMQDKIPLLAAFAAVRSNGSGHDSTGTMAVTSTRAGTAARSWEFLPVPAERAMQSPPNEKQLVNALHADLARQGLYFDRDFIANIYVCLKSEPLNLIIGPPGFGKSSLVAALARSLGHGQALLKIAVRRSWAEDRHLLGAFDSFHGRYDPGSTGLVPRMLQAAEDWKTVRKGVYLVLMDEFNLAAPEYYFSQLLQALPGDDPVRAIALYDPATTGGDGFPASITIAPNLRFWGTINYDETTERLSPRVLDRTGMIFLQETDVRKALDRDTPPMAGISALDLFEKFLRDAEQCPAELWETVSPIIDLLRSTEAEYGPRIELSPRVQQGIRRYLANSTGALEPRLAADFVAQQRILPVLRGRGTGFLARIRRLQELLFDKGLSRSAQHVERALAQAEQQFGEVDFLAY